MIKQDYKDQKPVRDTFTITENVQIIAVLFIMFFGVGIVEAIL